MIIEIEDTLFFKVVNIVKDRDSSIYDQLQQIKPFDILANARAVKTDKVKTTIRTAIRELVSDNINPTKYQVHKRTKTPYATLKKYFDDIKVEETA